MNVIFLILISFVEDLLAVKFQNKEIRIPMDIKIKIQGNFFIINLCIIISFFPILF